MKPELIALLVICVVCTVVGIGFFEFLTVFLAANAGCIAL